MGKNQHVIPHNGEWAVKGEGNSRVSVTFDTQAEAIDWARATAQNQKSEMIIHRRNGQIHARNSNGNDPKPPKG